MANKFVLTIGISNYGLVSAVNRGDLDIGDLIPSSVAYGLFIADASGKVAQVSGTGTAGQALISNGAGAFPTWQSPGANPTASVGLTVVNGTATTFMRSDGAPALSQAIAPTWSASHIWQISGTTVMKTVAAGVEVGQASLATNATTGFPFISTCAGVPTGVPTGIAGCAPLVIDSTNHHLYFYSGSWIQADGGGGGGSPAGSDTWIQYNATGSFGADTNFVWHYTTQTFNITGGGGQFFQAGGGTYGAYINDGTRFAYIVSASWAAQFTDGHRVAQFSDGTQAAWFQNNTGATITSTICSLQQGFTTNDANRRALLVDVSTGYAGTFDDSLAGGTFVVRLINALTSAAYITDGTRATTFSDTAQAQSITDGTTTVKLCDGTYGVNVTAGPVTVLGTTGNSYRWGSNTSASSNVNLLTVPLTINIYGATTSLMGEPDDWLLVNSAGTNRKIPCYNV